MQLPDVNALVAILVLNPESYIIKNYGLTKGVVFKYYNASERQATPESQQKQITPENEQKFNEVYGKIEPDSVIELLYNYYLGKRKLSGLYLMSYDVWNGATPSQESLNTVKILLANGADPNRKNDSVTIH